MIKKYQLKNGLSVILVESHKSPVVTVQMWVRTGSADEPQSLRGISHFIEHLVFKGTQKYGVGQIASTVEADGGELNAYTSFDQTVFHVTISRKFLSTGLDVLAEMMGRPTFAPNEIDNEREVVLEEIKRSLDSSHRQASRLLFESLYKRHPYGQPVLGYEEIIRQVSPTDIAQYFQQRYLAQNMILLVIGDLNGEEVKPLINKQFSFLNGKSVKPVRRLSEKPVRRPRIMVRGSHFKEYFLFISWPLPQAQHRDLPALEALSMILGQGDSSRLSQKLRFELNLVNFVGSQIFTAQNPGFISISASLPPGPLTPVLQEITRELHRLTSQPPSLKELEKALINIQSEQYYGLETVEGLARKFGHFEHLFKDYRYFDKYMDQISKLTIEDLKRVYKKYLKVDRLIVSALTPESSRDSIEKEIKTWVQNLTLHQQKSPHKKKNVTQKIPSRKWFSSIPHHLKNQSLEAQKIQFQNGTTLLLKPNFDTPVINIRAVFLGGSRIESEAQQGLNELLSRTWVSATHQRTEPQVLADIESMAASLSAHGGRNTAGLSMTVLEPFLQPMLEIFKDVFLLSTLPDDVVLRERQQILEQIRLRHDNPAQQVMLNFNSQLFGHHPYGRDPLGQEKTVSQLSGAMAREHLKKMQMSSNLTLSATGHFDPEELQIFCEELSSHLPQGQRLLKPIPPPELKKNLRHFASSPKEQIHLIVGYPGLTLRDPDKYALQVLESILSGQGGRLFVELRDKASLAYSVAPLRMEGLETGYFGAYIGCSPDKGPKALAMLREQLFKIKNEKVKISELERAQRYLIGRHDIDLQRNSALSAGLLFDEIYGLDYLETFKFDQKILNVTAEDVLRVAQKILSGHEVTCAVGSQAPWTSVEPSMAPLEEGLSSSAK